MGSLVSAEAARRTSFARALLAEPPPWHGAASLLLTHAPPPPLPLSLQMLAGLEPGADEIVLLKTSSSVFQSTNIDYLLRNLGVRQLVLCGCVTDQ